MLSGNKGKQSYASLAKSYLQTPRFSPFDMVTGNRSIVAFNISYLYDKTDIMAEAIDYILDKFADGTFTPLPIKTYDFADVAQAHKDIESGATVGKLILTH